MGGRWGVWPAGKPWQRHQRPPLVATRACASGVLLIRPCKHPGKTFEDWPNSNSNCPSPSFSFYLSPLVSLILNTVPDTGSPTVWDCVKQFSEWKVLNKSRVKVHQMCVCSALWMLLLREWKGKAKTAGPLYRYSHANTYAKCRTIVQSYAVWEATETKKNDSV